MLRVTATPLTLQGDATELIEPHNAVTRARAKCTINEARRRRFADIEAPAPYQPASTSLVLAAWAGTVALGKRAPRPKAKPAAKHAPRITPADNSYCFACHINLKREPLADKHRLAGVGCARCHGTHRLPVRTRRWDKLTRKLISDDGVRMVK